ncbi:hypothetical protein D3C76_1274980 [compost metagenome]
MLPGRGEFAGLRTLFIQTETVVLEELNGHGPDFSRRILRQDGAGAAALLQGVGTGVSTRGQRLRPRNDVFALGGVIGHVARDRQQRIQTLGGTDIRWHLHRCSLLRFQVIATTVTEITFRAPDPSTATGAGDNQGKCGKSGHSLHALYFLN